MTQQAIVRCFTACGIMLILSAFASLINMINNYDTFIENSESHVVSAFDG